MRSSERYDGKEQAQNCEVEYSVDVPVPQIMETVCLKRVSERMEECIVEEIMDTLAPGMLEESIEAVRHFPGEQMQNYTAEQNVDSRISHAKEEVIGDVKHIPQEEVECLDKTVDVSTRETSPSTHSTI